MSAVMRKCTKCSEIKPLSEFYRKSKNSTYRGRCKVCYLKKVKETYDKDPVGHNHREKLTKYRITQEQFDDLIARSNGLCEICGAEYKVIDHNHTTGLVRGLLCLLCNQGLGMFKDSPDRLHRAIEYLIREEE